MPIETDRYSERLRARILDLERQRVLIARLEGSKQEADISEPVNCGGLGRIRHFRRQTSTGWPANSLPIDPACAALGIQGLDLIRAQVFQNAGCNWRCWYCYVPFPLLAAAEDRSEWIEPRILVGRYLAETDRPQMIDLSGGQPDLVPEWMLWTMQALREAGAANSTYLWVDDNLSNDYFWRFLSEKDIETVATWPMLGRVGCFKGFDSESFAFNTAATPDLFDRQFELFARHLALGVDCYGYITLTGPNSSAVKEAMPRLMDRLQRVHEMLPLRTIPLEIELWGPVLARMTHQRRDSLEVQQRAIDAWNEELVQRFSTDLRNTPTHLVPMRG